jgi:hypothetical protein
MALSCGKEKSIMTNQHDTRIEETEIFGFLGDVAYRLIFAGDSLRALAEVWHDRGSEDQQICIQQGCDFYVKLYIKVVM